MTLTSKLMVMLNFITFSLFAQGAIQNLDELTVNEAQRLMSQGELSSEALTLYYLRKIENVDRAGIQLNAIGQLNQQAMEQAKVLDQEREKGNVRSLIHGIPIVLKDNIDTTDGMASTAGSIALQDNYPQQEAYLVRLLRQAGAVVLGKANMSEWANARSFNASAGWSGLYGQTKNPYDPSRSPCGSSSGSAVAVAANLTLLSIGTETNGSLVCPGSMNGVVAIKPTVGLISRNGVIPIAHSFDTPGPIARTLTDAVILLQILASKDPDDEQSVKGENDYLHYLKKTGLQGKRIGLVTNLLPQTRFVSKLLDKHILTLESLGATVIQVPLLFKYDGWAMDKTNVLLMEFKTDLEQYLSERNVKHIKSFADLIKFNKVHAATEMEYFEQEIFELTQASAGIADTEYTNTLMRIKNHAGKLGIDATLTKYDLDFFVSPTLEGPAPSIDLIYGKGAKVASVAAPAAFSGYPHITVPMGMVQNMPVGLSFFGSHLSEGQLISAAFAFEQATLARRKPTFMSN
jgi:amidase